MHEPHALPWKNIALLTATRSTPSGTPLSWPRQSSHFSSLLALAASLSALAEYARLPPVCSG